MKMYIAVKDNIPEGFSILSAAHASLACYKKFEDHPDMQEWVNGIFYKVICKVDEKEFERLRKVEDHIVLSESALDSQEVSIAFRPREEYPKMFKFLKLWR